MPGRCVAMWCGNTTKDGYSLHKFPKDPFLRTRWNRFVKAKREDWQDATEHSLLCSFHFEAEWLLGEMMKREGCRNKIDLFPGAVPTVHKTPTPEQLAGVRQRQSKTTRPRACTSTNTDAAVPVKTPRTSTAVGKLQRNRVSQSKFSSVGVSLKLLCFVLNRYSIAWCHQKRFGIINRAHSPILPVIYIGMTHKVLKVQKLVKTCMYHCK